jgi:hypothetical protein
MESSASVVKNTCLLARYLAVDICKPHRKHLLSCQECVFFGLLPSIVSTCHTKTFELFGPKISYILTINVRTCFMLFVRSGSITYVSVPGNSC